jgi:hypothetical protein
MTLTMLLVVLAGAEAFAPPPLSPTHAYNSYTHSHFLTPCLHFGNTRMWMAGREAGARNYTHSTMQVTGKGALWDDYELDTRLIKGGYHGDEWTTDPLGRSVVNPPVFHVSTVTFPTVAALREARQDHPFMGIFTRLAPPVAARPACRTVLSSLSPALCGGAPVCVWQGCHMADTAIRRTMRSRRPSRCSRAATMRWQSRRGWRPSTRPSSPSCRRATTSWCLTVCMTRRDPSATGFLPSLTCGALTSRPPPHQSS